MIKRYQSAEISQIWSEQNKFNLWRDVEIAACQAWAREGRIPADIITKISKPVEVTPEKVSEIEERVQHETIAFLEAWKEVAGLQEYGKYIHFGMTSSDLLDTALSLQIRQSAKIIDSMVSELLSTLKDKAHQYKNLTCIGRSHGVHAEPITFGMKFANYYSELKTWLEEWQYIIENSCVGMFSGAVGNYGIITPQVEQNICEVLGLKVAPASTQVISRDRHARVIMYLGLLGSIIEKIATELRHLQRTEVLEVEEPFSPGQKGSSAMPHKRNPWKSENLTGLSRLLRSYISPALENIALWHERDMSHSSVERVVFPDAFHIAAFMLERIDYILANLLVHEQNISRNLNVYGGVVHSQKVLIALIESGKYNRESAYELVQGYAHQAWNNAEGDFKALIASDQDIIAAIGEESLEQIFSELIDENVVNQIFERIFS